MLTKMTKRIILSTSLKKNENELMDFDLTKRLTNYFVKRIKKKLGTGTKT